MFAMISLFPFFSPFLFLFFLNNILHASETDTPRPLIYIYYSGIEKAPEPIKLEHSKWARHWYSLGYLPFILSESYASLNPHHRSLKGIDCIHKAEAIEQAVMQTPNKEIFYADLNTPLITVKDENLIKLFDCKPINNENYKYLIGGRNSNKRNIAILQPQFHLPTHLGHQLGDHHITFVSSRKEIDENPSAKYDKIILIVQHPIISSSSNFELSKALLAEPLSSSTSNEDDFINDKWKNDLNSWLKSKNVMVIAMDDPIASQIVMDYHLGVWRAKPKDTFVPESFRALSKSSYSILPLELYEESKPKEAKLYKMLKDHFKSELSVIKKIEEDILGLPLYSQQ